LLSNNSRGEHASEDAGDDNDPCLSVSI
jgi:hypothetical protein